MPPAYYMFEEQHHDGQNDDITEPDGEPTDWETFEPVASC